MLRAWMVVGLALGGWGCGGDDVVSGAHTGAGGTTSATGGAGGQGASSTGGQSPGGADAGVEVDTSGIWGAGFQNAGDVADVTVGHVPGLAVSGADVAGVHLSANGGDDWFPNNTGLTTTNDTRVAGLRFSATVANRVYLFSSTANGQGTDNHFWRGDYDIDNKTIALWTEIAALPKGASAGNAPPNHPRQTGRKMIALDEGNDVAYLGTVDGVYAVVLSSGARSQLALAGEAVTSVEIDPLSDSVLFATADQGGGVHRITGVHATPSVTSYSPGALANAQACRAVVENGATRLYVATGRSVSASSNANSILRWNGAGFGAIANWSDMSGSGPTALNADETGTTNTWAGIDAIRLPGDLTTRLLVSHSGNNMGATGTKVGWTDYDGSPPAWEKVTAAVTDYRISDPAGPSWWLSENLGSLMLDKGGFDSVNPVIDPNDATRWYVFGRSGMWRTRDAGAFWHPIVRGTAVTTSWAIHPLASDSAKVGVADVDWTWLRSTDAFETQPMSDNAPVSTVGWNLAEGPSGTMVLTVGERDANAGGGCWTHADPWGSGNWTNEVLSGTAAPWPTVAATPRCTGAALTQDGTHEVLIAAFQGGSVRRKLGLGNAGSWSTPTFATTVSNTQKQQRVMFAHNDASVVWLLDPSSGLWQSTDTGETWTSRQTFSFTTPFTGHLRHSPSSTGVYYFCVPNELWKITDGDSSSPTLTQIGAPDIVAPSALAVHPTSGHVVVAENATQSSLPNLWHSIDGGGTWADVTVPRWQAIGWTIKYLSWGANDTIYAAMFSGYAKVRGL